MSRVAWIRVAPAIVAAVGVAACMVDFDKYGYTPGVCGNGTTELGEACDSSGVETATCNPNCSAPICGDGYLNWTAGERCDNGTANGSSSCSAACTAAPFVLDPDIGPATVTFPLRPSVNVTAADGEPAFVVAWVAAAGGSGPRRIFKRTYRLDGSAVESAPVALSSSPINATCTAMATSSAGHSLVVWNDETAAGNEVHYSLIEADGSIWSQGEQSIAGSAVGVFNGCPEVAAGPDDAFCILWQDAAGQARVDCLDSAGSAVGEPATLGGAFSSGSHRPWGARAIWDAGDGFIAAWFDAVQQPDQNHFLVAQQLDATGAPFGDVATISELFGQYSGNGMRHGNGYGFVTSFGMRGAFEQAEEHTRFLLSRYEVFGTSPTSAEVLVSEEHVDEFGGRIIGHPSGRFAAVWSAIQGTGCELRARLFDESAAPVGASFSLGLDAGEECGEGVEGVATEAGDVMLVWTWRSAPPAGDARLDAMIIRGMLAADE